MGEAGEAEQSAESLRETIRAGADPLGEAFTAIRSPLVRREIGAFYTPLEIVDSMVEWALSAKPSRLVDPGSGSGRFAIAALRVDPDIEIVAVDLDPLATLLTRANLAVLGARKATVLNADYLTVRLPTHEGTTAWVGNPPYVRHHGLTPAAKRWAGKAARRLGHSVSGLAGLHALFFLATALRATLNNPLRPMERPSVRAADAVRGLEEHARRPYGEVGWHSHWLAGGGPHRHDGDPRPETEWERRRGTGRG